MNYFIDFEATQFSNEIISVGCVREDGETFYALVAPAEGKLTPFITNLTGITKEMLATAFSPDAVFEQFYHWVFDGEQTPNFFVWGNSDSDFTKGTFKRTESFFARMALGYLSGGMKDYSKQFCAKAGLDHPIKLIKVYNAFDPDAVQNHNALDDAMMLWRIYQEANNRTSEELKTYMAEKLPNNVKTAPVTKVAKPIPEIVPWTKAGFAPGTICIIKSNTKQAMLHWDNVHDAAAWILENKVSEKDRPNTPLSRVERRIIQAYSDGKTYHNLNWRYVPMEGQTANG